jgi:hypothetical protein
MRARDERLAVGSTWLLSVLVLGGLITGVEGLRSLATASMRNPDTAAA